MQRLVGPTGVRSDGDYHLAMVRGVVVGWFDRREVTADAAFAWLVGYARGGEHYGNVCMLRYQRRCQNQPAL